MATLNLDQLENTYKKKHEIGNIKPILPFVTTSGKGLKDNFNDLMGEYVRQFCGHTIIEKSKITDGIEFEDPLISKLTSQIEFQNSSQLDLERFLRQFLFGSNHDMKVFHPYVYNFLPDKESYRKYAAFIADVLVNKDDEIIAIFKDKQSEDLLTELILENLEVKSAQIKEKGRYQGLLPFLSNLYREDLLFISKHRDYFLSHFALLTHFYSFMYLCQLLFKFEQFHIGDFTKASAFYFSLDWESLSKKRQATCSQLGFRAIRDKLPHLFVHVHTLSQLSMQSNEAVEQPLLTYRDLYELLDTEEERYTFTTSLNEWIVKYTEIFELDDEEHEPSLELHQGMKNLFFKVKKGINPQAADKYGKNLQAFGGKTFIKGRTSLGHVFNLTQEMLLLLTAVCVRDRRIPLNALFNEFSKRGVAFDRLSKRAIIELFDSLNILDKKSDSGDAQYVKPIL